ncbi:MAG: hypothetical protein ABIO04_08610, partial [Ferruginibacter sp.]
VKDKELYQYRYAEDHNDSKSSGVSKGVFMLVFTIAIGLAGYTMYNLYINPSSNIQKYQVTQPVRSDSIADTIDAKKPLKKLRSKAKKTANLSQVNKENDEPDNKSLYDEKTESSAVSLHVGNKYKVINPAFFHTLPDVKTKQIAYITGKSGIITALIEKNEFIYVVLTNDEGESTKGWLMKKDLIAVND